MSTKSITRAAIVASIYVTVSILLAPFSFGAIQVRVAEALTMLPVISPVSIYGVTLGCIITNLYGAATGANILGIVDVFLGSGATLVAAIMSYKLRNIRFKGVPIASCLPPILINAVVIGGELSVAITGGLSVASWGLFGLQVGLGQLASCAVLGIPLVKLLEKKNIII